MKKFIINDTSILDTRIDKYLKNSFSTISQSFLEKNLRKGNIKVNNKKINSSYRLKINDEIVIFNYSEESYTNLLKKSSKKSIPYNYSKLFKSSIIYENNDFIIINKWTGIATQGGSKINISIDDIIKSISIKYNLVHRLDRETSGLLIIGKNLQSTKIFGKLFKEHKILKIYLATCQGSPKNTESEIKLSIVNKRDINKESISITKYKVFQNKDKLSNIIFSPVTGKTHQIRIVAKHLGCPIVGDTKYNIQSKFSFEKLKLNAHMLKFTYDNYDYNFFSNLPDHFNNFFKKNNLKSINKKELMKIL